MTRKICVFTATRAEYGLLRWVMQGIEDAPGLTLQIIASGTHLLPEFGLTYREIEKDGFAIDRKIDMQLTSDSKPAITRSMGHALIGLADAFDELRPDLLLVLGDRFELLSAVSAALVAGVPVAHLHGGEITEGAFDDAIRHAITKMSHLHFVAAEEYRSRVIQLGEEPERVFVVGATGLDNLARLTLLPRAEIESRLNLTFGPKNLLITFHPATLDHGDPVEQTKELLAALAELEGTNFILTLPNADPGSDGIRQLVLEFAEQHPNAWAFSSLGQLLYLSCMAQCDAVVGNSSSGIIEAPALHKGTINIGSRQKGRLMADSVITCEPRRHAISEALRVSFTPAFQARLAQVRNPYGEAGASGKIVELAQSTDLERVVSKRFYDLPSSAVRKS